MSKRTLGIYELRVDWDIEVKRFKYRKNAYKHFDLLCKKYPNAHVQMTMEQHLCSTGMKCQYSIYSTFKNV